MLINQEAITYMTQKRSWEIGDFIPRESEVLLSIGRSLEILHNTDADNKQVLSVEAARMLVLLVQFCNHQDIDLCNSVDRLMGFEGKKC